MMTEQDKLVGRLLLERGLVSREMLQQAGGVVISRRQSGQQAEVLQTLVDLGGLSREAAAGVWQEVYGGAGAVATAPPPVGRPDTGSYPRPDTGSYVRPSAPDPLGGFGTAPGQIPPTIDGTGPPIPHTIDPSTQGGGGLGAIPPTIDGTGPGFPGPPPGLPGAPAGPPPAFPVNPEGNSAIAPANGFGGSDSGFSPMGESFGAPPADTTAGSGFGLGAAAGGSGFGSSPGGLGGSPGGSGGFSSDPLADMQPSATSTPGVPAPVKKPVSSRRVQRTKSGKAAPKRRKGASAQASGRTSGRQDGGGGGLGLIAGSLVIALALVAGAAYYVRSTRATPQVGDPGTSPTESPDENASPGETPTASVSPTQRPTQSPTRRPTPQATISAKIEVPEGMSQEELEEFSKDIADQAIGAARDLKLEANLAGGMEILKRYPEELKGTEGYTWIQKEIANFERFLGFVDQLQAALEGPANSPDLIDLIKRIEGGKIPDDMLELDAVAVFVERARSKIGGEKYDEISFAAQQLGEDE